VASVTADQFKVTCWLPGVAVKFKGTYRPPCRISIALISALSTTLVKPTTSPPLAFAVAMISLITALFWAPAVANKSKLPSTFWPLMKTLKTRWPLAVHTGSQKCSRTR